MKAKVDPVTFLVLAVAGLGWSVYTNVAAEPPKVCQTFEVTTTVQDGKTLETRKCVGWAA